MSDATQMPMTPPPPPQPVEYDPDAPFWGRKPVNNAQTIINIMINSRI